MSFFVSSDSVLNHFQYFHFSKRLPCLSTLSHLQSFWPKLISSQSFVCSELLLEGSSALKETRQLIFFFQLGKTTRKRVLNVFSLPKTYIQHHREKLILHPPNSSILHIPRNIYIHWPRKLIGHILWLLALNSQWLLFIRSTYNPGHLLRRHSPVTYLHIYEKNISRSQWRRKRDIFSASFKWLLADWKILLIKWWFVCEINDILESNTFMSPEWCWCH